MSLLSEFEAKAEAMAETMLDHATVTASLKKKVEAGEAAIEDAVKGVEDKLAAAKDEILGEVRSMLDKLKAEMLGDFGTVSTDAVSKAKDAVAALKAELPDPATASASIPVTTEDGSPSAGGSASASDPASSSAAVDPGVTDAVKPVSVIAPSGAMVTVDSAVGATTHEAEDGTVTVLPHDGTDAHAHDSAMQPAEVKTEAVQEAVQATVDAGVAVAERAEASVPEAAPVV